MKGIDRLHEIAEDVGRTAWLRELGAALSETADAIEREARDLSGYESDVLAWVEENGGLDAVRERLMPEGIEWLLEVWPKWSNGEYCKFGDWWVSDNYGEPKPKQFRKLSIYTPEQLDEWGQGDGESFGYEWDFVRPSDPKYRPDKVEPPAPKVYDADGVEVHKGDEVWSTTGEFDGKRTVSSVHIDPDEPPYAMFEELQKPYSCLCCYLTHRAPVLAADGVPLEVGQTVWDANGDELVIGALEDGGHTVTCRYADVGDGIPTHGMWSPSDLSHQRPVLDADGVPIKKGDTVWHKGTGEKYRVFRFSDEEDRVWGESDLGSFFLDCSMLTHTKPEPDSWSSVWADVSNGNETPEGMMRRCRALAERGE